MDLPGDLALDTPNLFVFASKLVPLVVYPLGFSCVLVAIVLLRGQPRRWQSLVLSTALLVLWLASSRWVAFSLLRSLEWRDLPPVPLPSADVIVVLGGSTEPASAPRSGVEFKEATNRLLHAARLFQEGKAPLIIASGGRLPWLGATEPESFEMSEILQRLGVPAEAIVQENRSQNTYENAVDTQRILATRGLRHVILVTSALHMPRAAGLFRHQGLDVQPAPTDFIVTEDDRWGFRDGNSASVVLAVLPDVGSLMWTTLAVKEYLGLAMCRLQGLTD